MRFGYNKLKGTPPLQINNTMGGVAEDYIIYGNSNGGISLNNPILKNNNISLGVIPTTLHALIKDNIFDFAQKSTSKVTHYLSSITYNGSEDWVFAENWSNTANGLYAFCITKPQNAKTCAKGTSNLFSIITSEEQRPISNEIIIGTELVILNINGITSVTDLKNYLATRSLIVIYELVTPIIETISMPTLTLEDGINIIEANSNLSASQIDINLWNNFHDLRTYTTQDSNNVYTTDNKLLILKEVN